jgi:hypothetical protein
MKLLTLTALAAVVAAHGDHEHDQQPIEGPLNGLWYNSLPGDGGTQVRDAVWRKRLQTISIDLTLGRFRLLRNLNLRSSSISSVSLQRQVQL